MAPILDKIKNIFENEKETLEISADDAGEYIESSLESKLKTVEKQSENLVDEGNSIVKQLDRELENLDEYESDEDIQAVDDVTDNLYNKKKKLLQSFSKQEDIVEHLEETKVLHGKFNEVSRKELAVLKRTKSEAGGILDTLEELESHIEEVEDFIDSEYEVKEKVERVKDLGENRESLLDEISEIGQELNSLDIQTAEKSVEDAETEIEEFKQSELWTEREEIEKEIEELESKIEGEEKELLKAVGRAERGLKKLIYAIEKDGLQFDGELGKLKKLRDREIYELEKLEDTVNESLEKINDELLSEKQMKKFQSAMNELKQFENVKSEIERFKDRKKKAEQRLEDHEADSELKELESRKDSLVEELETRRDEKKTMEQEIISLQETLKDNRDEIRKLVNEVMEPDIELNFDDN